MASEIIRAAVKGDLDVLIWSLERNKIRFMEDARYAFEYAIGYDHLHICKWFLTLPDEYGIKLDYYLNVAFGQGYLDLYKWLLSLPEEKYTINFHSRWGGDIVNVFESEGIDGYFRDAMADGHWDICRLAL